MAQLVLITPVNGATVLGKVGNETLTFHLPAMNCPVEITDAIVCERVQTNQGPGFQSSAFDIMDMVLVTVRLLPAMYYVVPEGSGLAKLYDDAVKKIQMVRAGIVPPTTADLKRVNDRKMN